MNAVVGSDTMWWKLVENCILCAIQGYHNTTVVDYVTTETESKLPNCHKKLSQCVSNKADVLPWLKRLRQHKSLGKPQ